MIRFSLFCDDGHDFEGWFGSSSDFERQKESGLITCPVCHSPAVSKALMAPAVSTSRVKATIQPDNTAATETETRPFALDPQRAQMMETLRTMVRAVKANSEDVGSRFAEEARRIHYGESPERGIRGSASADDARALLEEGIGIAPLPELPEDLS